MRAVLSSLLVTPIMGPAGAVRNHCPLRPPRRAGGQPPGAAETSEVEVVVEPLLGSVLGGTLVVVVDDDVVVELVDAAAPDPLPDFGFALVPFKTGGLVVVVVVGALVADPGDNVAITCWACVICWSIAAMLDWYPARFPAFSAARAML
jgi:hypothetical protein